MTRYIAAMIALLAAGCTTGQARTILRSANHAVDGLREIDEIRDSDIDAMQTALSGVEISLESPGTPDFWVDAFLRAAASVITSLEGYGIDVPSWIMVALQSVGVFCKGICTLL